MPEQRKYLIVEHLEVDAINRFESIIIGFAQPCNFQQLIIQLLFSYLRRSWLIVLFLEVAKLERI